MIAILTLSKFPIQLRFLMPPIQIGENVTRVYKWNSSHIFAIKAYIKIFAIFLHEFPKMDI
jgi:hypothetical protein